MDDVKKRFEEWHKDIPSKEGKELYVMGTQDMIEKIKSDFNSALARIYSDNSERTDKQS